MADMTRAFDNKHLCKYFVFIPQTQFDTEYPSLDERVRWCYENIPEERLWDYEYDGTNKNYTFLKEGSKFSQHNINNSAVYNGLWNLRFFFEEKADAMAFKLMFL